MTLKTATKTTRVIAGHSITLQPGCRYWATRPLAGLVDGRRRQSYDVTFTLKSEQGFDILGEPVFVVAGLSYDDANNLIVAFNNEETSFEGRVW